MRLVRALSVIGLLSSMVVVADPLAGCFNEQKIVVITQDLEKAFQADFCAQGIKPADVQWISKTALPQIMNKSFLGVEPPPNWQILSDEVVQNCFREGDFCKNETQRQLVACLQIQVPVILLQLGPWVADNCKTINDTVIENWSNKREQVLDLIKQFENAN